MSNIKKYQDFQERFDEFENQEELEAGAQIQTEHKPTYDLTLSKLISPELAKYIFENEYFIQILVNNNLVSPILKIVNISVDHNLNYNIRVSLGEL